MAVNQSDRKIVDTGKDSGLIGNPTYRLTDVPIVGADYVPPAEVSDGIAGDDTELPESGEVGVPRNMQIESQTVRIQADGSAVIDAIISFEVAENAAKHEVRLSRV